MAEPTTWEGGKREEKLCHSHLYCKTCSWLTTIIMFHSTRPSIVFYQAFLGLELGKRCYPDPGMANEDGTDRIPYVPRKEDVCRDENGQKAKGLTYEGELNKVRFLQRGYYRKRGDRGT